VPTNDWSKVLQNQDEVNQISTICYTTNNNKTRKKKEGRNKKETAEKHNKFQSWIGGR